MTNEFRCPSCAAPLDAVGLAITVECDFCGTVATVPDELLAAQLRNQEREEALRQQQIQAEFDRLEDWRRTESAHFMELDRNGNRRPPRELSRLGFTMMMCGIFLPVPFVVGGVLYGALEAHSVLLIVSMSMLYPLIFFPLVMPGVFMMKKARDRFNSYRAVERVYRRRHLAIRHKHGIT